ncbi:MAG TPA: hypothetical protein VNI83_08280 [Vicinamibacterales bacterium]|nr:hypothetical protein [Vicinamibacterales bacterium]
MSLLQTQPLIVRVVEPPVEEATVADVLLGALGLTGVLLIVALLLGLLLGGLFVGVARLRAAYFREAPGAQELHVAGAIKAGR